jgi:hypothetical protein
VRSVLTISSYTTRANKTCVITIVILNSMNSQEPQAGLVFEQCAVYKCAIVLVRMAYEFLQLVSIGRSILIKTHQPPTCLRAAVLSRSAEPGTMQARRRCQTWAAGQCKAMRI